MSWKHFHLFLAFMDAQIRFAGPGIFKDFVVSPRQTHQKLRTSILKSVVYRVLFTIGLHYYVKSQNGH